MVRHFKACPKWCQFLSFMAKMSPDLKLSFCMWLGIHKYIYLIRSIHVGVIWYYCTSQIDAVIWSSLTVWFFSFGLRIIWFFNIKYHQNDSIFWLHFLRDILEPTESVLVPDEFQDFLQVSLEVKLVTTWICWQVIETRI